MPDTSFLFNSLGLSRTQLFGRLYSTFQPFFRTQGAILREIKLTLVNFNHSGIAVLTQVSIWTGNTVGCVVISMGKNSTGNRIRVRYEVLQRGSTVLPSQMLSCSKTAMPEWLKLSIVIISIGFVKAKCFLQSENRGTDVGVVSNDRAGQSKQK